MLFQSQKTIHQPGRFGCQNAGLPATVGMSSQPDAAALALAKLKYFHAKTLSIARGFSRPRRSIRPLLPKRQIVTQYANARLDEDIRQRNQQWRVAI